MTDIANATATTLDADQAKRYATQWLDDLRIAIAAESADDLEPLFTELATWRDFMAFPWDFHHTLERAGTVVELIANAREWKAAGFTLNTEQPPTVRDGNIVAFFDFTTQTRINRGYVLLVRDGDRFVASALQTQVIGLQDFPERTSHHRPQGKVYGIVPGRTRWTADREQEASFQDTEPTVLVLGAGHNGLAIAARLGVLGVPTLVIDKQAQVGDQWRQRYASLALHSIVQGDNLPYLPLPPTWTAHTPKDKWADFLESYAKLMDLSIWTSTEFIAGEYDEESQRWSIRVRRGDGSIRELHPRHFVVAGGLFAGPKIPEVPGLDTFTGEVTHSDCFQDGDQFDGKRALVVGAGVSAHELAHDLWEHGADVTMLQRSATYVVRFETNHKLWNPLFVEDMPFPQDFADQIAYAIPNERTDPINKELVKIGAEMDRDLLDRLEARGFKLEWGPDGTGILGAHMSGKDAYQIDIGASELIAEGLVHLKQGVELAEVRGNTVVFSDGSELADIELIVFATGYHQFWGHIKPMLGHAADRIDKAYGRAADGEYANTWRRSAQPGLWFATGFIRMASHYSRFTALLIKAIEEGIEPYDIDHTDGRPAS